MISAGSNGCLSTRTNGTLYSWGQNNAGQLGLGNTTYYSSPKQIGALATWLKIYPSKNVFFMASK